MSSEVTFAPVRVRFEKIENGTSGARWRASMPTKAASSASEDRKSTRLNSSHANISYAVFCLKKKNNPKTFLVRPCYTHLLSFQLLDRHSTHLNSLHANLSYAVYCLYTHSNYLSNT